MHAMVLNALRTPLVLTERAEHLPRPGEIRVQIGACGVSQLHSRPLPCAGKPAYERQFTARTATVPEARAFADANRQGSA